MMAGAVEFREGGTVTNPGGFLAGATYAGLKTYSEDKLDLGIILSESPCTTAGVFTTNAIRSPSVTVTQENVNAGPVRALIVNAGIANTCVGEQGYTDAKEMTTLAARRLGLQPDEVLVCSTGVIGVELPMSLIRTGVEQIDLSTDGGHAVARAMMTTDTHPKEVAVRFELDGRQVDMGGVVKGSGMIHPNMATMLSFVTTDAAGGERLPSGYIEGGCRHLVQHDDRGWRQQYQRHGAGDGQRQGRKCCRRRGIVPTRILSRKPCSKSASTWPRSWPGTAKAHLA